MLSPLPAIAYAASLLTTHLSPKSFTRTTIIPYGTSILLKRLTTSAHLQTHTPTLVSRNIDGFRLDERTCRQFVDGQLSTTTAVLSPREFRLYNMRSMKTDCEVCSIVQRPTSYRALFIIKHPVSNMSVSHSHSIIKMTLLSQMYALGVIQPACAQDLAKIVSADQVQLSRHSSERIIMCASSNGLRSTIFHSLSSREGMLGMQALARRTACISRWTSSISQSEVAALRHSR
jgi:hypothetical protein